MTTEKEAKPSAILGDWFVSTPESEAMLAEEVAALRKNEKAQVIRHNHTTRDIKPPRQCPACDRRAHGCPCPRGDVPLGRLYGVDMGVKRDAPLSFDPACPIHPGITTPPGGESRGDLC